MTKSELARRILEQVREKNRDKGGRNYYLTNIGHPVISCLMDRYKQSIGEPIYFPVTDEQRIEFELSLFKPEILSLIREDSDRRGSTPKQRA